MSKTAKWIIAIIVLVIIVIIIWAYAATHPPAVSAVQTSQTTAQAVATSTSSDQPAIASGDSDQDLQQDSASIDQQMTGLSSDNTSADQSLNDQPVQQTN